jgi:hypothetical protein
VLYRGDIDEELHTDAWDQLNIDDHWILVSPDLGFDHWNVLGLFLLVVIYRVGWRWNLLYRSTSHWQVHP